MRRMVFNKLTLLTWREHRRKEENKNIKGWKAGMPSNTTLI
jgi:hypothetical protein